MKKSLLLFFLISCSWFLKAQDNVIDEIRVFQSHAIVEYG